MRVILLAYCCAAALSSQPASTTAEEPKSEIPDAVKKDLGEKTIAILSGATKVEAFRLEKLPTIGADKFQFEITATGKEFAAKARAFLFDEATRTLSGASGFRGDVAFRLWKEKESVTVVVDFEGSQFLLATRDADGKETHVAFGGFLFDAKGGFDKGDLFARVHGLALDAFPEDAKLKELKKVEVETVDPLKPIKR